MICNPQARRAHTFKQWILRRLRIFRETPIDDSRSEIAASAEQRLGESAIFLAVIGDVGWGCCKPD
jgi:hypothetical protein